MVRCLCTLGFACRANRRLKRARSPRISSFERLEQCKCRRLLLSLPSLPCTQFQLAVDEVEGVAEELDPWRHDTSVPLIIEVRLLFVCFSARMQTWVVWREAQLSSVGAFASLGSAIG